MSWQESVVGVGCHGIPDGWSGVGGSFWRPLIAPVAGSVNRRGSLTMAASSGAASGTLMTSMRHRAGLAVPVGGPVAGPSQPASSVSGRDPGGALDVDVDVPPVALVGDQGVGVRPAAGLDAAHLHRVVQVADVEDAHAAEPGLGGRAAGTRVQSVLARFSSTDMNSRLPIHRDVALPAGADHRGPQGRHPGIGDVVDVEAVEVPHERVVTLEAPGHCSRTRSTARVGRVEESGGLVQVGRQVHALGWRPRGSPVQERARRVDRRWSEAARPPPAPRAP